MIRVHIPSVHGVLAGLAFVLVAGLGAEAQLSTRGDLAGRLYWRGQGKWIEVEKDHMVFSGEITGTFFNDAGEGFLHRATAVCPGIRDTVRDVVNAHGYCVFTDEDGSKATFAWKCKGPRCDGDAEWISGTGKYAGLKGRVAFSTEVLDPLTDSGYAVMKGTWQRSE